GNDTEKLTAVEISDQTENRATDAPVNPQKLPGVAWGYQEKPVDKGTRKVGNPRNDTDAANILLDLSSVPRHQPNGSTDGKESVDSRENLLRKSITFHNFVSHTAEETQEIHS